MKYIFYKNLCKDRQLFPAQAGEFAKLNLFFCFFEKFKI